MKLSNIISKSILGLVAIVFFSATQGFAEQGNRRGDRLTDSRFDRGGRDRSGIDRGGRDRGGRDRRPPGNSPQPEVKYVSCGTGINQEVAYC